MMLKSPKHGLQKSNKKNLSTYTIGSVSTNDLKAPKHLIHIAVTNKHQQTSHIPLLGKLQQIQVKT